MVGETQTVPRELEHRLRVDLEAQRVVTGLLERVGDADAGRLAVLAGEAHGLPHELAMKLAKSTVAGAGALAVAADEDPSQLRINVTSPNGTTQAALEVLMHEERGFPDLLHRAVKAATDRSKELSGE